MNEDSKDASLADEGSEAAIVETGGVTPPVVKGAASATPKTDEVTPPPIEGAPFATAKIKEATVPVTDTDNKVPAPRPSPLSTGAYGLWPVDKEGALIGNPEDPAAVPDPANRAAVDIYFGIRTPPPPKDQADLQASIAAALGTVRKLYCSDGSPKPEFRLYYTRLYWLAELGLEDVAVPDIAKSGLDRLTGDLIDAEGASIKNRHLMTLGTRGAALGLIFMAGYLLLCAAGSLPVFPAIGVDPMTARSFMLLWVGCFVGVWLSYAIRTTQLTLRDLVITDSDRLFPLTRLLFAGLLTMALGLLISHGVFDIKLGSIAISEFTEDPSLALLIGLLCGVSELTLPTAFAKRANDFASKL